MNKDSLSGRNGFGRETATPASKRVGQIGQSGLLRAEKRPRLGRPHGRTRGHMTGRESSILGLTPKLVKHPVLAPSRLDRHPSSKLVK